MGVIIDTSIWSLALQRRNPVDNPETEALIELIGKGDGNNDWTSATGNFIRCSLYGAI